jgi:hypothetical protein
LQSQLEILPPSFLVGVSKTTSKLTPDGLSKTTLDKARQSMMDFNLLHSSSTEYGTNPAQQLIYTFESSDPLQLNFQTMDILMIE